MVQFFGFRSPGLEDAYARQAKASAEADREPEDTKLWVRSMLERFNLINMLLRRNPDDETLLVNRERIIFELGERAMPLDVYNRNKAMEKAMINGADHYLQHTFRMRADSNY